ncbi:MAG: AbrB/MazE/SpoVT family DNA-binding domain-containing protein [Terriglobales bacterium]
MKGAATAPARTPRLKSRISSRGQITVPVAVQRALGLRPGTPVEFELRERDAILRKSVPKVHPVDRLYGILANQGLPPTDVLIEQMRGPVPAFVRREAERLRRAELRKRHPRR